MELMYIGLTLLFFSLVQIAWLSNLIALFVY